MRSFVLKLAIPFSLSLVGVTSIQANTFEAGNNRDSSNNIESDHTQDFISNTEKLVAAGVPAHIAEKVQAQLEGENVKTIYTTSRSSLGGAIFASSGSDNLDKIVFSEGDETRTFDAAVMRTSTVGLRFDIHIKKIWLVPLGVNKDTVDSTKTRRYFGFNFSEFVQGIGFEASLLFPSSGTNQKLLVIGVGVGIGGGLGVSEVSITDL